MSSSHAGPSRAVPFRRVALVFFALLGVGLALGFVVYKKYVAYQPRVAEHVPADATLAARIDLTHVMLYEPARRSFLPLVERGVPAGRKRADALTAHGVRLGADVRELLLALGPGDEDWVLAIGGKLPESGLDETVAAVLADEQRPSTPGANGVRRLANGVAFAQAADSAFILASSAARLESALASRAVEPRLAPLTEGAGGIVVSGQHLGPPWRSLGASWRAGSYVSVKARAEVEPAAGGAEAVRGLLRRAARLDPALEAPLSRVELHSAGAATTFDLDLPREAVEALARWVAARTDPVGPSAVR